MKILPIFIPHLGCPFQCIYCNQNTITKTESVDFQKISQLIENFCKKNFAETDKEIAFYGGTFTALGKYLQEQLFALVKPFFSEIDGIRISTRPDAIDDNILAFCRENKVKTIELGIQSFADSVLSASARGYSGTAAISACRKVKSAGFRLGIQLMPGLPGFSRTALAETLRETIALSPEFVRIYPTVVLKKTLLEKWFQTGKYHPLELNEAVKIAASMKTELERHKIRVIKTGLHSDLETDEIAAGPFHPAFGELVRAEMMRRKIANNFFQNRTLVISPRDVSLFRGFSGMMLQKLKTELKIDKIPIFIDAAQSQNSFSFKNISEAIYW